MSQEAMRRLALEAHTRSRCAAQRLAEWEQRTNNNLIKTRCYRDATLLGMKYEHELNLRRELMKDLYESELNKWKNLMKIVQAVSKEKQLEQIKERAYRLKEKRETERREFVKECNKRRWRDGNDEIRAKESLAIAHQTIKDALVEVDGGEKALCVLETVSPIEQKKENQHESFRQKHADIKRALDVQVNFNKCQMELDKMMRCQEEEDLRRRIASLEIDECQKQWEAKRKMLQLGAEMRETSVKRQVERTMARDFECQKDKALLRYLLDKEKTLVEEEKQKKEREKLVSLEFISNNKKEDTSMIDLMQKEYAEKIRQKRDEEVKSQEEARYRLNKDVQRTRKTQIEEQKRKADEEREASEEEARVKERYLEEQGEQERKSHAEFKTRKLANMKENKELIELRRLELWREKQQNYLQHKEKEYEENLHQKNLKEFKSSY